MTDYGKRYHQAEAHRKGGQFSEAEEIFRELWDELCWLQGISVLKYEGKEQCGNPCPLCG